MDIAVAYGPKALQRAKEVADASSRLSDSDKRKIVQRKLDAKNAWLFSDYRYKKTKADIDKELGLSKFSSEYDVPALLASVPAAHLSLKNLDSSELTGRTTLYHGTPEKNYESIKEKGVVPRLRDPSEKYVYMTPNKNVANDYAYYRSTYNPETNKRIPGKVLEANVPLWKYNLENSLGLDTHQVKKIKGSIGPEYIKDSPHYVPNSLKEISQYIKARPVSFLKGVGKLAVGVSPAVIAAKILSEKVGFDKKWITNVKISFDKESANRNALLMRGLEGAVGAGIGGGAGYLSTDAPKKKVPLLDDPRFRNAVMGAGLGSLTTLGGSALNRKRKILQQKSLNYWRRSEEFNRYAKALQDSAVPLEQDIPEVFYHGFPSHFKEQIKKEGLKPSPVTKVHRSEGSSGAAERGKSVFLTKDPSYAKTYGKYRDDGYYHFNQDPSVASIVLPKKQSAKLRNIMKNESKVDLDLSRPGNLEDLNGVGQHIIDGVPVGIGSEFAHTGPISPQNIAFNKEDEYALIKKYIEDAVKKRQEPLGLKLEENLAKLKSDYAKKVESINNKFMGVL